VTRLKRSSRPTEIEKPQEDFLRQSAAETEVEERVNGESRDRHVIALSYTLSSSYVRGHRVMPMIRPGGVICGSTIKKRFEAAVIHLLIVVIIDFLELPLSRAARTASKNVRESSSSDHRISRERYRTRRHHYYPVHMAPAHSQSACAREASYSNAAAAGAECARKRALRWSCSGKVSERANKIIKFGVACMSGQMYGFGTNGAIL
jgi:hypothetical protein